MQKATSVLPKASEAVQNLTPSKELSAPKKLPAKKPNSNRPLTPKYTMSRNAIFKRVPIQKVETNNEQDLSANGSIGNFSSGNENKINNTVERAKEREESKIQHCAESMATDSQMSYP